MNIRKLTALDSESLKKLIEAIEDSLENKDFWLPINETSEIHFFDENWTEFYGLFEGERLVAASALFYNEHEFGESLSHLQRIGCKTAEIGRSMVHPQYRGNNYLLKINTELLKLAKSKGIELVLATIHPQNVPSQKSFQKLGFTKQCTYVKHGGFLRDIYTYDLT